MIKNLLITFLAALLLAPDPGWSQGSNGNGAGHTYAGRRNDQNDDTVGPFNPPADPNLGVIVGHDGHGTDSGALDSHGQVNGGGTGSADGGLTQGGPR